MTEAGWDFRRCLTASALLHALFFLISRGLPAFPAPPAVEVVVISPFLGTGPARLAAPSAKVVEPLKDWVTPTPTVKAVVKPPEDPVTPGGDIGSKGISPLTDGVDGRSAYGTREGQGDNGAPLTALPRLLNLDEILANLRKYYPESERRAGREGDVALTIHIGVDGKVSGVDVGHADSAAFGGAARRVGLLMRFSPAMREGGAVPASVGVPIRFRLQD